MKQPDKPVESSRIMEAIRAKRAPRTGKAGNIEELEAKLIADIESFDLSAAERQAIREQQALREFGGGDPESPFPKIVATGAERRLDLQQGRTSRAMGPAQGAIGTSSLLQQLRQQAATRQKEDHEALAERTTVNESIDQTLKYVFFYLHDFVQQVNIVKPPVPRRYAVADDVVFDDLVWQEGFADYRTQAQSAGALVELVSLSFQLASPKDFVVERDALRVDRLRNTLFDFGLQFSCKEFRNARSFVERAEFAIRGHVGVSVRWRADFAKGLIQVESRNLERPGTVTYTLDPAAVDQALLDEFGKLALGLPNVFRELAKRT